jgi:hypothetical protein
VNQQNADISRYPDQPDVARRLVGENA